MKPPASPGTTDGRPWPTMRVEEPIAPVEEFVRRMVAVRGEVVRLMVWEICKPLDDCLAEFDRTIE